MVRVQRGQFNDRRIALPTSAKSRRIALRLAVSVALGALGGVRGAAAQAGPLITFFGLVNGQGIPLLCSGSIEGAPICPVPSGSGFRLIIEGRPFSAPVGTSTFNPEGLPDLQVQVDEPLGNGSAAVCDNQLPSIGGVAPVSPPDLAFSDPGPVNDFACRFSAEPCTLDQFGEPRFLAANSTVQFCAVIDSVIGFASGDTRVSGRLRDTDGHVGAVQQLVVRVGGVEATSTPTSTAGTTHTPTRTPTSTATRTATSSPSPNQSPSATATATVTTTASGSPTPTPTSATPAMVTPTPTATPTAESSPTTSPARCAGDCDGNQTVSAEELVRGVRVALGLLPLAACPDLDASGDGAVSVDEPVLAVHHALNGCP
jgi:hypothetical protein